MITNQIITGIPFKQNPKLAKAEIDAVSHYRDMGENQLDWCYFIPANRWDDRDCYMINGLLRKELLTHRVIDMDRETILNLIPKIQSATTRGYAPCEFNIYKGLSTDSWITEKFDKFGNPIRRESYVDLGFGSFTSNPNIATQYSEKYNGKNRYLLSRKLDKNDLCLYIDNREYEWLLPPNICYSFVNKEVVQLPNGGKQITYYIKRRNK